MQEGTLFKLKANHLTFYLPELKVCVPAAAFEADPERPCCGKPYGLKPPP